MSVSKDIAQQLKNKDLISIRMVKKEDALNWFTLVNKVWRETYSHIFPEEVFVEKEEKVDKKVETFTSVIKNDNKNIAYIAEYKNELVGIMRGSIISSYEHFDKYADLIGIYINPKFQGNGIGTSFRKIFEKWAKENGASKYVIGVLKDNKKARKVYEEWGGKLSEFEEDYIKFNIKYKEVFYVYDL